VAAETGHTQAGVAEATLTLTEPGDLEIFAAAGPNLVSDRLRVSVLPVPVTPTVLAAASPTSPATAIPTPTADKPTPTPTSLPTATPLPATALDSPTSSPQAALTGGRRVDGWDLLVAFGAILLAGLVGFLGGRFVPKPLPRRVRLGLWVLIGGLSAYLLYGAGLLRPEQWLLAEPGLLVSRLSMAGLVFFFGLLALGLSSQNDRRRRAGMDAN
jgi:hypothetical protein